MVGAAACRSPAISLLQFCNARLRYYRHVQIFISDSQHSDISTPKTSSFQVAAMSFSRLEALVSQLQKLCDKFQSPNIRFSKSERLALPMLVDRLVDTATTLSHILHEKTTNKAPNETAKELARRLGSFPHIPSSLNKTILKRNLSLIFLGPQVSTIDSDQTRCRKKVLQARCEVLGSLAPGHVILWSVNLPPSGWVAGDMPNATFHYLMEELREETPPLCPEWLGAILHVWSSELPFSTSEKFLSFVKDSTSNASPKAQPANDDADMTPGSDPPIKKRRLYKSKTQETMSGGPVNVEVANPSHETLNHESGRAIIANVEKLERILGSLLYNGMMASRLRGGEVDGRIYPLTNCFRLHLASQSGGDFKVEVWRSSSTGSVITDAMDDPARLRSVLGDYIFEAMMASSWWRHMKQMPAIFNAVDISYPHGKNGDCKLEVRLNFKTGHSLFVELCPS
ncbi:hypothetical protein TOPH_01948 [Tolypocladium ophioglossoides CBS 100239]|uniref:Uncharacterized protein n=1 Tax=Tolypocladium ophioglossoides (strain CBS 100239) TaxID=1163406 RepID=A0A0L0NI96_TOLOC|nr:hypothetical protein TOPH_01948 [Tolypocladium ophioglossoides CBS 100239]